MAPLEPFWFPGAHGDKVQGFLVKPPNFDPNKKYPVKFLIHGGPAGPVGRRLELSLESANCSRPADTWSS
jgi:dipeptidyl aminopeptidase/acylaminoacyl peptidase